MGQLFNILLTTIIPIVAVAGLGAFLDRLKVIDAPSLSRVVIYLASPGLVFISLATSSITPTELASLTTFSLIAIGTLALLAWLISRWARMDRATASAFILTVVLMNTVNFGVPLSEFAFGQPGLERALYLGVLSGIYAYSLGIFIASWGEAPVLESLGNMFKVPMPYAAAAGLAFNLMQWPIPDLLFKVSTILGEAAIPMMLVIWGIQISRAKFVGHGRVIAGAVLMRLVGGALIAFLLATLLGLEGVTRQVAIVQTAVPTAVISAILATEFGGNAQLVSSITFASTLTALVTLPLVLWLVM